MSHGRRMSSAMFADKSRARSTKQLLSLFLQFIKDLKIQLIVVSIIIMVYTIGATYLPILIQQSIDKMLSNPVSNAISLLILIYATLSIIVWILQSLNTWIMAGVNSKLVDSMRRKTFEALVDADMGFHHKFQSGNISSRVTGDTQEITTGLNLITSTSTQILLIVATLVVLGSINVLMIFIALLAVPVALLITKFLSTIGKKRMLKTRQAYGKVSGKLAENLSGIIIAKSFNQEKHTSEQIRKLNDETYKYSKQLALAFIMVFPAISAISVFLVFAVLMYGGYIYPSSITIGEIYLSTIMVQRFLQPIMILSNSFVQLQSSLAAFDRIVDVLEAKPKIRDAPDAKPLVVNKGEIEFNNVSFSYTKDKEVLKNVSFTINAGKKTALVGKTGAGKTTLTALLMRFYDPDQGEIKIDGQNIKKITLDSLYANLSLVSQEPYLFADTVIENIRYGRPDATDEEIYALCKLIGADEFIEALPEGYLTLLQEGGKSLSSGQVQIITIARTMLSNPAILILDEATSRLDAYSEYLVQEAQMKLFKDRTTLIIAHRLSTIREVDQIVVIDDGEIKEIGTHEELMDKNGIYTELYNMYYAHQGLEILAD